MHIKRIEITGFKSFADRTMMELDPGVIAIVGPNGCGKSNVADALRWVFGEQNPRLLRGTQMQDVIFNGTDQRKGISRAEVSVTFVETTGFLSVEYSEVTITRRLFRDGESQYFINQNPCLLRDIRELFMGTGIGTNAYFLLEQGKIDMILSAKPEDRRAVFEEAAGIMKYKLKKKASLSRLEMTEANLLRLADIIREVKRQIISLERQAGKARRYQAAREELKGLELKVTRKELEDRLTELKGVQDRTAELESLRTALAEKVSGLESKVSEIERSHESTFEDLRQIDKTEVELYHQAQSMGSEINLLRERLAEFETRMHSDLEEIERSKIRIQDLQLQRQVQEENKNKFRETYRSQRESLEKRKTSLEEVVQLYENGSDDLNQAKSHYIEQKQEEAQYKNQIMVHHHRQKDIVIRGEKLITEKEKVQALLHEKQAEKKQREDARLQTESISSEIQNRLNDLTQQKAVQEKSLQDILKQSDFYKEQFVRNSARLEAAKDLGVLDREDAGTGKVFETVINVPAEYRRAVKYALGNKWRCSLKANRNEIQRVPSGVAFALDVAVAGQERKDFTQIPGFIAYAIDVVKVEAEFTNPARAFLEDLVIVKDLDALKNIDPGLLGQFRFVDLKGDFLDYDGAFHFSADHEDTTIDLAVVHSEIKIAAEKMESLQKEKLPYEERLESLNREIKDAQDKLRGKEIECANEKGHLERLSTKIRELNEEDWSLSKDQQDLEKEGQDLEAIMSNLSSKIDSMTHELEKTAAAIEDKEKTLSGLESEKEKSLIELAEVKVVTRSIEEEEIRFNSRLEEIHKSISELESIIERRTQEVDSLKSKKEEGRGRIETLEQDLLSREREKEALIERKESVARQVQEITEMLRADKEELERENAELGRFQSELSALEIKNAQTVMQRDNLCQRMKEKYDTDLMCWPLDENFILEEVQKTIAELQEKIRQMGDVNLVAIQEFDEYRTRYDFLIKQQEDLVKSKDDLVKAIQKVNVTIRELFIDTFEKIQGTFNDLFRKLFGGGRAVLELLDDGDVLECGINISAQPPGKKLQVISLLSGGERTMTALAMLLAIFKVRPSPFCFMDEMDAALDESNIIRFLGLLNEFKQQTQFVLITHNKKTVGVADMVYGVTMEESGVSKMVSVRLTKNEEKDKLVAVN